MLCSKELPDHWAVLLRRMGLESAQSDFSLGTPKTGSAKVFGDSVARGANTTGRANGEQKEASVKESRGNYQERVRTPGYSPSSFFPLVRSQESIDSKEAPTTTREPLTKVGLSVASATC